MANIPQEVRDKMTVYSDADKAKMELIKRAMQQPQDPYSLLPRKAKQKYSKKLALRLHLSRLKRLVNK